MKKLKGLLVCLFATAMLFSLAACDSFSKETGTEIITGQEALNLLENDNTVLVDASNIEGYTFNHIANAVSIPRAAITITVNDVPNMLASKEQIETVLGEAGIANDTTVIVYDTNNNMDAARLWWTMKIYGHENVKVVSGGKDALVAAGAEKNDDEVVITPTTYVAKDLDTSMIATEDDVLAQVNDPDQNTKLLDTRTLEEYNAGTIPSSVFINYVDNNNEDTTYKDITTIQNMYLDANIIPDDEVIMYCKTSIRGAETYLALYNAGFKNLKLYDGAYSEWVLDESNPIYYPADAPVEVAPSDNS